MTFPQRDLKAVIFRASLIGNIAQPTTQDLDGNPMDIPQGFRTIAGFVSTSANIAANPSIRIGNFNFGEEYYMQTRAIGTRLRGQPMDGLGVNSRDEDKFFNPIFIRRTAVITDPVIAELIFLGYLDQ